MLARYLRRLACPGKDQAAGESFPFAIVARSTRFPPCSWTTNRNAACTYAIPVMRLRAPRRAVCLGRRCPKAGWRAGVARDVSVSTASRWSPQPCAGMETLRLLHVDQVEQITARDGR